MDKFSVKYILNHSYGGLPSFISSNNTIIGMIISVICAKLWMPETEPRNLPWLSIALPIVPNFLSFSLGGFAIFIAFSNKGILSLVVEEGRDDSLYMQICSSFYVFIAAQTISLIVILILSSLYEYLSYGMLTTASLVGFFVFIYSILSAFSIGTNLVRMAILINNYEHTEDD